MTANSVTSDTLMKLHISLVIGEMIIKNNARTIDRKEFYVQEHL